MVSDTSNAPAISGVCSPAAGEDQPQTIVVHRADLCRLVDRVNEMRLLVPIDARGLATQPIDRPIAGSRDDPPGRAGRQAGLRPPLDGDRERFLDRLFGNVDVAEDADQAGHCST